MERCRPPDYCRADYRVPPMKHFRSALRAGIFCSFSEIRDVCSGICILARSGLAEGHCSAPRHAASVTGTPNVFAMFAAVLAVCAQPYLRIFSGPQDWRCLCGLGGGAKLTGVAIATAVASFDLESTKQPSTRDPRVNSASSLARDGPSHAHFGLLASRFTAYR